MHTQPAKYPRKRGVMTWDTKRLRRGLQRFTTEGLVEVVNDWCTAGSALRLKNDGMKEIFELSAILAFLTKSLRGADEKEK